MILALTVAVGMPLTALADPPAVSAPTMPAPFIGAPTNDNPESGQFSLNFDDQGRFLGSGTAPEHFADFNLSPERARAQARLTNGLPAGEASANSTVFTAFAQRLKDIAASQAVAVRSRR